MSNIDKRVLREAAVRAGGVKWQYMRATQHTKAYLTDEKGWTVVNCTDGDVPAKCAGFIESANPATVLALLDELEAAEKRNADLEGLLEAEVRLWTQRYDCANSRREVAEKRIAELEARAVKPVAWMRNANVTSFMSRFTTDEKYAIEQWGDDAVALYSIPVDFIPACFTDERNLMHINERGRETSLIWSKQNSDSGDIKLFRIAAAADKGE
ncbi:ead/Ea22-like family protein [Enterobacter hormaechei]|uniref:ead/Ea22-like family protein n=1 Tax=Enterobacter hormaechei TaxID=158836 RepID=UPI003B8B21C2